MSARMYRLTALAALALLSGCAAGQISLNVKSPPGTNLGRPMYMLVRQVDPKQYANEAYSEVASKVGAPDNTVLQTSVIYPGTIQRFQVKTPTEGALAVSFLFTAPDGNWQLLLSPPVTSAVDIELTVSRILSDSSPPALPQDMAAPEAKPPEAPKMPELPKEMPKLPGAK
jgi:intracellular growth IglE-like protein